MDPMNLSVLYDTFTNYYDRAIEARNKSEFEKAKKLFILSGETLLKLAQMSDGEFKRARMERADRLIAIANSLPVDDPVSQPGKKPSQASNKKASSVAAEDGESKFEAAEIPDIGFDDIAGLEDVKDAIRQRIINPRKYPEIYQAFNKKAGGGVLMYGPPGTGKTTIAKAIAHEVGAVFFSVQCSDIVDKWFGEAEKNVKKLFDTARQYEEAIIFFDDFESLGAKRGGHSTVMNRLIPELLTQIQGFASSNTTLLLLAATNRPWDMDSALLRPGRFSELLYIPLPDREARRFLIKKAFKNVPVKDDVDIEVILDCTEGFNGADVVEFCERSQDYAIKRSIENKGIIDMVKMDDIIETSKRVKSSVQAQDLIALKKFIEKVGA